MIMNIHFRKALLGVSNIINIYNILSTERVTNLVAECSEDARKCRGLHWAYGTASTLVIVTRVTRCHASPFVNLLNGFQRPCCSAVTRILRPQTPV